MLNSSLFQQSALLKSVWSVAHVSSSLAHAVKEKRNVLVSLLTLSSQDRELHKVAVLSAHEHTERTILLFTGNSAGESYQFQLLVTA